MRQNRLWLFILIIVLSTCVSGLQHADASTRAQTAPITVWTKFNDASPQNAQDEWMAAAFKEYRETTGNQVTSVTQPYDQINAKLNIAVRSGGTIPDVSYVDSQQVGFFVKNATLTDLTDYVKNAPWYKDINPAALASCTAPDGKILCVPTSTATTLIYYWKDLYPDGFPTTLDDLLKAAPALKEKNKFAISFKSAEKFAIDIVYYGLIKSAGGNIADKDGKAVWASEETVSALKKVRELFANKYAPESALTPGFDYENAFKQADAGGFIAGSWSYVFLNPLTAPDGTKFDEKAASLAAAYDAGKLDFAPPLSVSSDGKPYGIIVSTAWAIPRGAANIEAAKAFIDFQMTRERITKFAVAYGALPSLLSSLEDKEFQTPYWKAVASYLNDYGQNAPGLIDYDRGLTLLADTITRIMTDPSKDIMAELKAAQDEYNSGLK